MEEEEFRYMKNQEQVQVLESEYFKNPMWSKIKIRKLAKKLNLKESQIYKWNWDKRQIQERYLMKRIENQDIPDTIFRVIKPSKSDDEEEEEEEEQKTGESPES